MKKILAAALALLTAINIMCLCIFAEWESSADESAPTESAPAESGEKLPELTGNNCITVMNADNGQIVFTNRGNDIIAPTCSTKLTAMMVVWDAFESAGVPLNTSITVPREATQAMYIGETDINNPSLGLEVGDTYEAEDLMQATLVSNANDACFALCHYAATKLMNGTISDFVTEMNKKAASLGAENTVYQNCVGSSSAEAHTTVKDTAVIANAFYRYNTMLEMSSQARFIFDGQSTVHNKNYLLSSRLLSGYEMKEAKGMIAGQATSTGGYCLITSTESKDGITFIIAVMDAPGEKREDGVRSFPEGNAYENVQKLIPWALDSFTYHTLAEEGELIAEVKVAMGKSFDHVQAVTSGRFELLINNGIDPTMIQRHVEYSDRIYDGDYNGTPAKMLDAPVLKGDVLGKVVFTYGSEVLGSAELVAATSVEGSSLLTAISTLREILFSDFMLGLLKWIAIIAAAFIAYSIFAFVVRTVASARENAAGTDETEEEKPKKEEKVKKKRGKSK